MLEYVAVYSTFDEVVAIIQREAARDKPDSGLVNLRVAILQQCDKGHQMVFSDIDAEIAVDFQQVGNQFKGISLQWFEVRNCTDASYLKACLQISVAQVLAGGIALQKAANAAEDIGVPAATILNHESDGIENASFPCNFLVDHRIVGAHKVAETFDYQG